jgi:hypothetical protein
MGSGPLVIGLGGAGVSIVAGMGVDRLLIDTDISTKDRFPGEHIIVLGESILRGEGAGRNLKLGMIAFRSGMERIAQEITGRFPVLIVAGSEGGTGLAGAVELNTFLNRMGIPRFTFLISDEGHGADPSREGMAIALLSGLLRPGLLVSGDRCNDLAKALPLLSLTSAPTEGIRLPPDAWSRIGSAKGMFELEVTELSLDDIRSMGEGPGPSSRGISLAAVEAPKAVPASEIKRAIEYIFGNSEMLGVGIVETGAERVTMVCISQPVNPGPLPTGGAAIDISELIDGEALEPGKGPEMLR